MSSNTPSHNLRRVQLQSAVGVVVAGNLSISIGLLPWLSLSAHGQAALLETNPTPNAPTFNIPTQITPTPVAPEPAPSTEAEAYVPLEPAYTPEPAPAYEPEPYVEAAPSAPYADVTPSEPHWEPEPSYVSPAAPKPEIIAQPELAPQPSGGCAALLDPSVAPGTGCAPSAPIVETATPLIPQPNEPGIIANDQAAPPARQIKPTVASSVPPARRLTTAISPVQQPAVQTATPVIPNYNAVIAPAPTYHAEAVTPAPHVRPTAPTSNISVPSAPPLSAPPQQKFTVVKPDRYALKPVGRNPLQWVLGDRAMLFPLPFPVAVSSAFGWRQHPIQKNWHLHSGIDFAAAHGTSVVAAYDGEVAIANYVGGYGLSVLLNHQNGERQTRYAHLSEIYVKPGQKIKQGDVLGAVGSTGNSTGPHLHFETLIKTPNGMVVVDPTEDVKASLVAALEQMKAREKADIAEAAPKIPKELANEKQKSIPTFMLKAIAPHQATRHLSQPYFIE